MVYLPASPTPLWRQKFQCPSIWLSIINLVYKTVYENEPKLLIQIWWDLVWIPPGNKNPHVCLMKLDVGVTWEDLMNWSDFDLCDLNFKFTGGQRVTNQNHSCLHNAGQNVMKHYGILYWLSLCELIRHIHWKGICWNSWCTLQWIFYQPMPDEYVHIHVSTLNKHLLRQCPMPSAGFCLRKQENHWSMMVHQSVVRLTEVWSKFKYRSNRSECGENEHKPIHKSDATIWWKITAAWWYANGMSDSLWGVHSCNMKAIPWVVVELININQLTNQKPSYGRKSEAMTKCWSVVRHT